MRLLKQASCATPQASKAAFALFKFGQEEAAKRGLLLVDTKYEFGKDADGNIMLIDEIHTPDSSRSPFSFWLPETLCHVFLGAVTPSKHASNVQTHSNSLTSCCVGRYDYQASSPTTVLRSTT